MPLKIGQLEIPDDVAAQPFAVLGKTGSGKTYAAKGLVEQLLAQGRRVCVLDPTGAWWGLRVGADGKSPGHKIAIFGGRHGDVPISEHAGAALGRLIGSNRLSAVIDLRDLLLAQQRRFVEAFLESLYQANSQPLHLVVDEADEFAPQRSAPETAGMLGQFDRVARRGRSRGFRLGMITQRPARLNKDVLAQAASLFALALTLPHDRAAVEAWVSGAIGKDETREMMRHLPSLRKGEGYVAIPEIAVACRVKFPSISTFDSSSTPDDSIEMPTATLAAMDLTQLRAAMAEAVKEAEDSDPRRLRKRIAELEAQVRKVEVPRADSAQLAEFEQRAAAAEKRMRSMLIAAEEASPVLRRVAADISTIAERLDVIHFGRGAEEIAAVASRIADRPPPQDPAPAPVLAPAGEAADRNGLPGPHARILDAIAWWSALGIDRPSRHQVAGIAGYAPTSGTYDTYVSRMRSAGLIDVGDGALALTNLGAGLAQSPAAAPTPGELHRRVLERLPDPLAKLLRVLLQRAEPMGRTELAELSGYAPSSGTFDTYVSRLRSLGLVRIPRKTSIQAAEFLFPRPPRPHHHAGAGR